jgi:pyridinium-3,5-bisthiocarboxylic acid mononucleotide nickel chelatase
VVQPVQIARIAEIDLANRVPDLTSERPGYNLHMTETTIHFDCFSGISGDMVLGALLDAGLEPGVLQAALDSLGLGIKLETETVKRCGFRATKANIVCKDEDDYRFLPDIEAIIARSSLTAPQRTLATRIFHKLAHAESVAHGMPLEKVHFHEVGALDSVADILGAAVGLSLLNATHVTSTPVPTGHGTVKGAHGVMPIPTPGTAELLRGVPISKFTAKGELTTPTGAAILASIVTEYTDHPAMTIHRIGHGAGTKDFLEHPNILRLFVGTRSTPLPTVTLMECNLDDCPAEIVGYAIERLQGAGALDVFTIPIQMKKQRPGVLLSVLANTVDVPALEEILFRETGTFGVRKSVVERTVLNRETLTVETRFGPLPAKRGWRGNHEILTPEYEACAAAARQHGVPLRVVYAAVHQSARTE